MYDHEAFEVGADTGTTSLVTLGASWTRLRTNDRIFPTRGFRIRFDVLGAHDDVLSSETFLQVKIAGKLVRSIGRTRFLARAEVGRTFTDNFRGLPPTVRFFTGGDQSVRGYQYQSLAPVDEAENVIGGKVLVTSSAELEHRFLEKWGLAGFLDAGNSLEAFSGSLETGLGGGMRWLSPIGMVRLDVAFALSREGNPARLHITIGPDL
jgi:translocation and assembly module TamA